MCGIDDVPSDDMTTYYDDYLPGGFSEYDNKISDHRPVGLSIPVPLENSGCPGELAPQCIGKPSATAPFLPSRRSLGGAFASWMTATVAGMFLSA